MMFGTHTVRIYTITALFLGSLLYLTLCMDQAVNIFDEGITLFGVSVLVERAWTVIVSGVSIVLIFLIVDRFCVRRYAVLAAIVALLWLQNAHAYGGATIPCLALMLAGLLFLVPALKQSAAALRCYEPAATFGNYAILRTKAS